MALTPDLSISIETARDYFNLSDDTIYGGANEARADCRVFLSSYKVAYNGTTTTLTSTSDTSNPETDSSWRINLIEDGAHKFYFVIVTDEYDIGTTYNIYDAVFVGSDVYRSVVGSNVGQSLSNTTYWELITDPSLLANNVGETNESENIVSTIYLRVLYPNSAYQFATDISDQCSCDCETLEELQDYIDFRRMLDAVDIADSRTEILNGELICRRISSRFIDC